MARRLALAAIGGLLVLAAPAQAGLTPEQALPILNQWKTQAHEPTIPSFDSAENTGCQHHNHYMALNGGQLTHEEDPAKPGYTAGGSTLLVFALPPNQQKAEAKPDTTGSNPPSSPAAEAPNANK